MNIYKTAVAFFAVQSILIVILLNNNYMKDFLYLQSMGSTMELVLGILIVLLNLVAIIVMRILYLSGLEAEQLKTTALKYNHLVEQNQIYRQHHHDLKNHLTVVLGLLQLGKYTELKEYLVSYLRTVNDTMLKIETGMDEIDVLLSAKVNEAKRKDTQVDLIIGNYIKSSRKNILDLVEILGNIINNALEAVQELDPDERIIKLTFQKDPLDYIFECTNALPKSSPNSPELFLREGFSTKQGEGRGNGLFIVKRLSERLGGSVTIDTSEGQFRIKVEIPRHKLEEG
ncbi:sensor histidine kinase [Desulfitobacterium sp.]|uniref:sensor histidine kinase n=1 Tax=Desulfitobacterium sp. TaxID=49981 RepID=UPI002B204D4C|nr:GHKL domain-containing protein [Desulfitobacterium sp.]MEA4902312.1 GHKL domain-containing protein [Desulfitobacterium sp.]